jgi:VIT1/CCC1 family predicted Fe2+/Mn2+ transporter
VNPVERSTPVETPEDPSARAGGVSGDAADHVAAARVRARQALGGETHLGAVDDWRQALVSARDAIILIWLVWAAVQGSGTAPWPGRMYPILALGIAVFLSIIAGRSVVVQLEFYLSVLQRERKEIREHPDQEIGELRVLYEAKGFREPLLSRVVETLAADDDRLLKVMMEEELGLRMHHMDHPLLVGLWHFLVSGAAGLAATLPLLWLTPQGARRWVPIGGGALLALLAVITARTRRQAVMKTVVVAITTALVAGGVVYFLSTWAAGLNLPPSD